MLYLKNTLNSKWSCLKNCQFVCDTEIIYRQVCQMFTTQSQTLPEMQKRGCYSYLWRECKRCMIDIRTSGCLPVHCYAVAMVYSKRGCFYAVAQLLGCSRWMPTSPFQNSPPLVSVVNRSLDTCHQCKSDGLCCTISGKIHIHGTTGASVMRNVPQKTPPMKCWRVLRGLAAWTAYKLPLCWYPALTSPHYPSARRDKAEAWAIPHVKLWIEIQQKSPLTAN